jgi:hypothetical protein
MNINYCKTIGKKPAYDNNLNLINTIENFDANEKKSIDFLINKNKDAILNNDEDFQKKLLNYINQPEIIKVSEFEKKNLLTVKPGNTYLSNNNEPNFESNVADIKKFYNVNYDNLDENELQSTSIENIHKMNELPDGPFQKLNAPADQRSEQVLFGSNENGNLHPINFEQEKLLSKSNQIKEEPKEKCKNNDQNNTNITSPFNVTHFGRNSTENPDNWLYKDDLPMNGGKIGGIVGFDQLESQFAMYDPNRMNLEVADSSNFNNIPYNDLRKPVVYEN